MAFYNTGKERCQQLTIDKKVNGISLAGYPKTYSIRNAFTVNGHSYGHLTYLYNFAQLTVSQYLERLADFKAYVSAAEGGVDIDEITEVGYGAYKDNVTSCPIGDLSL
jgi:hypothetical protein